MARRRLKNVKRASLDSDDEQATDTQVENLRRLLAAVNHDLRQPLQAMELLCGVLETKIKDEVALKIILQLEETLDSAKGILESRLALDRAKSCAIFPDYFERPVAALDEPKENNLAETAKPEEALASTIFIVDDDQYICRAMRDFLKSHGHAVELFESSEHFLASYRPVRDGCLLLDALLPGMSGLELLKKIKETDFQLPAIMMTGSGDVSLAVQAMKSGAVDFIEKPINHKELLSLISDVLKQPRGTHRSMGDRTAAKAKLAKLSVRERQIMDKVLDGHPNKNIAADLGISQRTVESHRANIMRKMEVRSLPALLRLTLSAN